ncbi:hypothetical protein IVB29_33915 [Bradyrhizobium sp. 1]|nr:hypothetical protein [Bradyrhizobium sp. 1]
MKSNIYSFGSGGPRGSAPVLLGGQCRCGYVFFPMQAYGCEQCGNHGDALTPCELSTGGTLLAEAVVHLHADKNRPAPFTIVKVALDDGPVVRSVLAEDSAAVSPGQRMTARLVPVRSGESGETVLDLRFTAAI